MPAKGGDTVDVLTKLGYSKEKIDELVAEGAIAVGEN